MVLPEILNAFGDNYIYLVEYAPGKAFCVDPGDASVAADALAEKGLVLTHILATHHHADHIGGIGVLQQQFDCEVVSSDKNRIPVTGIVVSGGDTFAIGSVTVRVISTPGHTKTGVCFYVTGSTLDQDMLFTGDTLFVGGCGRLFECDAKTMFHSFEKLAGLPDDTFVYPGHNYTQENIRFALTVEPDNKALKQKLEEVVEQDRQHTPTVPSTLGEERQLNVFMRADTPGQFGCLREQKDYF